MSLLGKVFAILNVLTALGFMIVASMDYGKHVTWKQAVFRSDVMINGLPLSDEDLDDQGYPRANDLTKDLLRQIFANAGPPVQTQVKEVQRVQGLLEKQITDAGDQPKQVSEYARILLPFASSNLQRESMLALHHYLADAKTTDLLKKNLAEAVATARKDSQGPGNTLKFSEALNLALRELPGEPARPFEQALQLALAPEGANISVDQVVADTVEKQHAALKARFDGLFREALEPRKTFAGASPPGKERPLEEHRAVIAHLLFNLAGVLPAGDAPPPAAEASVPDIWEVEAYKRVIAVVGLQAMVKEINAEALVLADLQRELVQELANERVSFTAAQTQLYRQAQDVADKVDRAKADLERAKLQVAAQAKLVSLRKKDVADAEEDLNGFRKVASARFKELVDMRNALFKVRVEVREATRENQNRARKIAELEDRTTQDAAPQR